MTPSQSRSIRVVVADDHVGFRLALVSLLGERDDIEIVGQAGRGDATLELIQRLIPDLAIVDHSMPGLTGIEVAEAVQAEAISTRVVLLTLCSDIALARRALEVGAAAYVLKNAVLDDLASAISVALDGGRFVSTPLNVA